MPVPGYCRKRTRRPLAGRPSVTTAPRSSWLLMLFLTAARSMSRPSGVDMRMRATATAASDRIVLTRCAETLKLGGFQRACRLLGGAGVRAGEDDALHQRAHW